MSFQHLLDSYTGCLPDWLEEAEAGADDASQHQPPAAAPTLPTVTEEEEREILGDDDDTENADDNTSIPDADADVEAAMRDWDRVAAAATRAAVPPRADAEDEPMDTTEAGAERCRHSPSTAGADQQAAVQVPTAQVEAEDPQSTTTSSGAGATRGRRRRAPRHRPQAATQRAPPQAGNEADERSTSGASSKRSHRGKRSGLGVQLRRINDTVRSAGLEWRDAALLLVRLIGDQDDETWCALRTQLVAHQHSDWVRPLERLRQQQQHDEPPRGRRGALSWQQVAVFLVDFIDEHVYGARSTPPLAQHQCGDWAPVFNSIAQLMRARRQRVRNGRQLDSTDAK